MRNTHRRIAALEQALPAAPNPDQADGEIIRRALQLLSVEDLEVLRTAAEAEMKGDSWSQRELTAPEMAAQRAFARAVAQTQQSSGQMR